MDVFLHLTRPLFLRLTEVLPCLWPPPGQSLVRPNTLFVISLCQLMSYVIAHYGFFLIIMSPSFIVYTKCSISQRRQSTFSGFLKNLGSDSCRSSSLNMSEGSYVTSLAAVRCLFAKYTTDYTGTSKKLFVNDIRCS